MRLGVVILAAGRSSRMGQPKLLLPWGETSILAHLIWQWRQLGARQIAVVCAPDSVLREEMQRLGLGNDSQITNPAPERGMFSSLQSAARWTGWREDLTKFAIVLGDQPHLSEETLRRIVAMSASVAIEVCQPRQGGHRRHPVILPAATFRGMAASEAGSLKEFLDNQRVVYRDLDDPALGLDIDRMEDYERARQMFQEKKH